MNIRIFDAPADVSRAIARTVVQRIGSLERPSVALSGGSSPRELYTILGAEPYRSELAQKAITWIVVDERYVPATDPQSNARMIRETLFAHGVSPSHRFLEFETHFSEAERSAAVFEAGWQKLGLQKLDVIILGVGDDGHTASLFPGTGVIDVVDRVAAAVYVPRLEQWRVTLTLPVIREAALRLVQVVGASKAEVVRDVRDGATHPIAQATSGVETWWFLDEAAAGNANKT